MTVVWVKICGITNEEDALLATALDADALGFIFAPSRRQVKPDIVRDIVKRLPGEVLTVGVFRKERPERVVEIVNRVGLHAVQLHDATLTEVRYVCERVRFVIHAFSAGEPALAAAENSPADLIHLDSESPGSGKVFDWRLAEGAPRGMKVVLAGGLTPDNVADAIRLVRPWGVDVASGVEASPGRKDPRKLRRFVEAARNADHDLAEVVGEPLSRRGDDDGVPGVSRPWDWQLDD